MKTAILSLVVVAALVASAGSAGARPPRYSGNQYTPVDTAPSYDLPRYTGGYSLPYSARGNAFNDYGVAYNSSFSRGPAAGSLTRLSSGGYVNGPPQGPTLFRGLRR